MTESAAVFPALLPGGWLSDLSVRVRSGGSSAGVCMLIARCHEVKWMPWERMKGEGALSKGVLGTGIKRL